MVDSVGYQCSDTGRSALDDDGRLEPYWNHQPIYPMAISKSGWRLWVHGDTAYAAKSRGDIHTGESSAAGDANSKRDKSHHCYRT